MSSRTVVAGRVVLAAAVAVCMAAACLALDVPFLSGHVNDTAHMLSAGAVNDIEHLLKRYEDSTGNQIAVLTIPSLEGESLEEYSLRVAETWKLGKKGVDNGALLLIVKNDRKIRIEVGYGLEGSLTDAATSFIITNEMTPRFKNGDFDGGVRAAVTAMISAADGHLDTSSKSASSSGNLGGAGLIFFLAFWFGIVGIFTIQALFGKGCMSWFLYAFLIPFYAGPGLILADAGLTGVALAVFFGYLIGFPLLRMLLPKTQWGSRIQSKFGAMSFSVGRASGSGWSSGGGSSSSGFSGGGGSFGGGGSSGSW